MPGYDPNQIEKKWQQVWATHKVFAAGTDTSKPKYYALDMFPYPSGEGLHVGHPEGYTASDIVARYKRGKGFNVLHPMGWDAFGLPAEQYAIKTNTHPRETTEKNIGKFRQQLQSLGFSYDWDREVDTTDPGYYRWTQWIFLKLFDTWFDAEQQKGRPIAELVEEFRNAKRETRNAKGEICRWEELNPTEQRKILAKYRLAYESEAPVNWCPALGTVLANEEVIDGKSEVGGFPVERKPMKQWMLRITAYAQRLLDGLDGLEWSESLKEMQRNWIGKSEGALVTFQIASSHIAPGLPGETAPSIVIVFTTRPDTLFGATYMVLAPEHPLVSKITTSDQKTKIEAYQKWAASRSDRERQEDTQKTGESTGAYAINPVNNEQIPIFISDYVLMGYGTGAIMAVPAHDERDHEFATKFNIPIKQVVAPKDGSAFNVQSSAFTDEGVAVHSPWIEGLPTQEAKNKIIGMLEEKKLGKRQTNFKIRDWLFSRQRYWGEPFPLVHLEDGTTVPLAEDQLPVKLPELEDFKPTGTIDPPLSKAPEWFNVQVVVEEAQRHEGTEARRENVARVVPMGTPGAVKGRRELNTMPQWAGSCWYYLRYTDARNDQAFIDPQLEKYWMNGGVDLYIGGVEHAVLHLLYSRFWHKVLFDRGLVSTQEPFRKLVNQGLILGEIEYRTWLKDVTPAEAKGTGGIAWKDMKFTNISAEHVDKKWTKLSENEVKDLAERIAAGFDELGSTDLRDGKYVSSKILGSEEIVKQGEQFYLKDLPNIRVDASSFKMSKSRGNVVNPDHVVRDYGADALRLFEMFMGPLEQVKPWSTTGVEGVYRFLQRVWRNLIDEEDRLKVVDVAADDALLRAMHRMVKKVSEDIERLAFNTAISAMMEFNNTLAKTPAVPRQVAETFVRVLEPFAPHFAEEMYGRMQNAKCKVQNDGGIVSVSQTPWPTFDAAMCIDLTLDLPVQINGKLKGRVMVDANADETTVFAATLADPEIQRHLAGKDPKKKIYVKGRMVNLVV